ncbi:MAG: hypothetical protein GY913_29555 [Proteobacteria bacterium]|nr:hypothetical protein [Pseudomonadota bacterium]MCP4921062.1 hypothetical protein [Pseudomonadota bacterium]
MISLLLACTSTDPDTPSDSGPGDSEAAWTGCHGQPRTADDHELLLSFPYDADASPADTWRRYSYDGAVTQVDSLEPGRATSGRGAWTPDGAFVFTVDDEGGLHGPANSLTTPYTSSVTIDPTGEVAWIVDPNWAENGGGVYRSTIDCDTGALGDAELVWTGKNTSVIALRPGSTEAAVVTRELDGVFGIVHVVDLETLDVLAHIDAFGDDEAIVSDAAWDHEGERLLVADYSEWSGVPTRVAVVSDSGVMGVLDVPDPVSIVTAPFPGSSALVVSGYDNAVFELERTDDGYTLGAEIASPALPGSAVGVRRGALAGRVVVVENTGLWELEFTEGGGVTDRGRLLDGSGLDEIPGAIALQP